MEYTELTAEHKEATLKARLLQFENDHFQHMINLAVHEKDSSEYDATVTALAQLDKAHAVNKKELDKVKAAKSATPAAK